MIHLFQFLLPLYAIVIAASSYVFGYEQLPIKVLQILLDSATTVIVYLVALEIFGARVALIGGVMQMVYPFSIYSTLFIGPEAPFTFLLGLFVLQTLYGLKYGRSRYFGASGGALGLATLMRGTTQLIPAFVPLLIMSFQPSGLVRRRSLMFFVIPFLVLILPWSIRNYVVLGEFIPVGLAGGNFLYGASEDFWTISTREEALPIALDSLRANGKIPEDAYASGVYDADRTAIRAGLELYKTRIQEGAVSILSLMGRKAVHLWYSTESGENQGIILAINLFLYLLAIAGAAQAVMQNNRYAYLLLGILGYFVAVHLAMVPLFRYMLPVMPYMMIFAAAAMVRWCELWLPGASNMMGTNGSYS